MLAWLFAALTCVTTLVWLWLGLCTGWQRNAHHRLETSDSPTDLTDPPHITLICPGRNEAQCLPDTLPSLCNQNYPNYDVIFVDDQSSDNTPQITEKLAINHSQLTVFRNDIDPPPGWVGKCWAIHQAYQHLQANEQASQDRLTTKDRLLCFTDADIIWHPDCLRTAVAHAYQHHADLVALFPKLNFGSTLERLAESTMVLALWLLYPFEKAMDPKNPNTLCGGAFILVKRSLYDTIGGHQSVADQIVEDLALGKALKAAGARIRINATQTLLQCRMYNSPQDLWEGLTKNAYAGLNHNPLIGFAVITWTLFGNVLLPAYLPLAIAWWVVTASTPALITAVLTTITLLLQAWPMYTVRRLLELPRRYTWAVPLGSGIYMVFMLASIWRYYRGGNLWKGRRYDYSMHHRKL